MTTISPEAVIAARSQGKAEGKPKWSIVVAAVNGFEPLSGCLRAIDRIPERGTAEIIVVDRCRVADQVRRQFPTVTVLGAGADMTIPQMRSKGILASTGEWVIVTEDHCEPRKGWLKAFQSEIDSGGWDVIAGAVENGCRDRLVDWAAFFTEYSEYMAPRQAGETGDLPGMNTAYRRSALNAIPGLVESAVWETFLHARLKEAGFRLYSSSKVLLDHCKSFGYWDFLTQRYYLARSFAGMRVRGEPLSRKLLWGAASPALMVLLPLRIIQRVRQRPRYAGKLRKSFPILLTFTAAWTLGELTGYLFGEGDASQKVE